MGAKSKNVRLTAETPLGRTGKGIPRTFPKCTLEESLCIPSAIKEKNGGNPWPPGDVANAIGVGKAGDRFYYLAASSKHYGLTTGGRDTTDIALAPLGRELVYAPDKQTEESLKLKAFLTVEKFKEVLTYYKGSKLPEMKYLSNTLSRQFGLPPDAHEEFSRLFRENCSYLGIGEGFEETDQPRDSGTATDKGSAQERGGTVTLAEPSTETGLRAFVVMPLRERDKGHSEGFFTEVLSSLIAPAGREAGFTVTTANRQGSDVIQSTIVNELLEADLVIADLTEHNPNVLFELGIRMAFDKPVALIRAKGTDAIFDVDNMLRVFDYAPNLWPSNVERDVPKLADHLRATWEGKDKAQTYMKLLRRKPADRQSPEGNKD